MSIIERYALWVAHDAGATLPPVNVVAAIVTQNALRGADTTDLKGEVYVVVPPQWIGDWETGYKLAPAYQHLWRAPLDSLAALPDPPRHAPYRPAELPPAACGPSPLQRRSPAPRREPSRERSRGRPRSGAHERGQ